MAKKNLPIPFQYKTEAVLNADDINDSLDKLYIMLMKLLRNGLIKVLIG